MNYTLYNKELDRKLIHPRVGVWFTTDLEEAKLMLKDCHAFVGEMQKSNFIIINLDTDEEALF